jgi:endonuclease-3
VTDQLFRKYRTPQDYLDVPEEQLAADIKPTGFFNQKTRSIRGAARMIVDEYGGGVPGTMEELVTLPGVARKTANIVLGNSFDTVVGIAVDTHVRRVSRRLGFTSHEDPEKIERDLMELLPRPQWFPFTYRLIDHGRAVCVARTPKCEICPVADLCPASRV